MTERSIRGTSTSLYLNLDLMQALGLQETVVAMLVVVVRAFRSGSLVALHGNACEVWYWRWRSELTPAWDYIVNHYPAVIATGEDPVNIFVADAAHVLEGSSRL